MDVTEMQRRVAQERVARLATVTAAGAPHLVPVCFAIADSEIVSAVDAKPKSTSALRRLANVRGNPAVCLLADNYEEDWHRLWWVRVDGRARVADGGADRDRAAAALVAKYEQYRAEPPPGPVLVITPVAWRGWTAAP